MLLIRPQHHDITQDRIRNKVAKELENFGRRVQYSVFECELSKARYRELYRRLCVLTFGEMEGNIRIYEICENCAKRTRMIGVPDEEDKFSREDVIVL